MEVDTSTHLKIYTHTTGYFCARVDIVPVSKKVDIATYSYASTSCFRFINSQGDAVLKKVAVAYLVPAM